MIAMTTRLLPAGVACLLALAVAAQPPRPQPLIPLTHAHAHNDYAHTRPLLDALDCGFCSIEADIYLVDGKLLVGHNRLDLRPGRTLQSLYLDPLREIIRKNGGRVYRDGPTVQLLIDIKTEAEATYAALSAVLKDYAPMLTVFHPDKTEPGAVTVVISGNRPRKTMAAQKQRLAACDGLIEDIDNPPSVRLVPLVSSRWGITFKWTGRGQLPDDQRQLLRTLVEKAHKNGQRLRFWGAPDDLNAWKELRAAGVDLINTDHLPECRDFLLSTTQP